jgi:hypothetical protein
MAIQFYFLFFWGVSSPKSTSSIGVKLKIGCSNPFSEWRRGCCPSMISEKQDHQP